MVNKQDVVDHVLCGMADDPFQAGTPFKGHPKEGIGIGSSRVEVIKAFGPPAKASSDQPGWESLKYTDRGLILALKEGKVDFIQVSFEPLN